MLYILWVWTNVRWHVSTIIMDALIFTAPSILCDLSIQLRRPHSHSWRLPIFYTVFVVLLFPWSHTICRLPILAFFTWWQCSSLENPRDGGAWWAAVHGVAQSWTRLKRLSSSNMHVSFLHVFHGFIVHLFLVLNNIPLYGCTIVYSSIHLLKSILVASKFLTIINKATISIHVQNLQWT